MKTASRLYSICLLLSLALAGCGDQAVDNSKPIYGKETGLPANCRAYVQHSIDSYRSKEFTAEETMIGLERNCGAQGALWTN